MAKAVEGAAKTGGTIGGTAAGAASAGPLGAAAAALFTGKTIWKVLGAVLAAIFLFMYLIANAVGIILHYLGFTSADSYVDQARQMELQTIQMQINQIFRDGEFYSEITGLLEQYRDAKLEEIEADFSENWEEYDDYEVADTYENVLLPSLREYLAVLIEESWNGSQIVSFNGYGGISADIGGGGNLSSTYDEYFALAAATYQVPEALLKAMAKVESDFDRYAVSAVGAEGIMQLMPNTALSLGVTDTFDPKQNIMGGAKYVAELFKTFGAYPNAVELVIAAYNAGPGAVKRAGYRIPQNGETPEHVKKVMSYLTIGEEHLEDSSGYVGESSSVSKILLRELVEEQGDSFFAWSVTGTHTETSESGDGEEEEELEIVDYELSITLSPALSPTQSGYSYRYVTDQTTFNHVLRLFHLLENGKEAAEGLIFRAASWKNYVTGFGASEDIFSSEIQTGGDRIEYETAAGCVKDVAYYNQGEEPWASMPYGKSTIKVSGCGPTALAIAISTLTNETVTPKDTADYAVSIGAYVYGQGTSHSFPSDAAKHWGLSVERVKREQIDYVVQNLRDGKMAVVICAENTISKNGHFIVLTGITEAGYIAIADPGSRQRSGNLYSPQTIQSYARNLAAGAIWIIGNE